MAQNGNDLGHFRRLVMVSTDNVFVFSDLDCSLRRDRGRIPSKPTGFLWIGGILVAGLGWRIGGTLGPSAMPAKAN